MTNKQYKYTIYRKTKGQIVCKWLVTNDIVEVSEVIRTTNRLFVLSGQVSSYLLLCCKGLYYKMEDGRIVLGE